MPRLLALDPSLAETGFAVLDITTETVLSRGTIPINRRQAHSKRLSALADAIRKLIRSQRPTEAAIELPFVGHNRSTALTLGAVRGVLLYLTELHRLPVHEYTTTQIKSAITGNPTASKHQVQQMVRRLTGLTVTNHNESDAIATALTHLRYRHFRLTRLQSTLS